MKALGLAAFCMLLLLFVSAPSYAIEKPYQGNVSIEYSNETLKHSFDIVLDRSIEDGNIFLSLPNSSVEGRCIESNKGGQEFITHYIPEDCDSAEFVANRDLESAFENESGFGVTKDDTFLTRHGGGRSPFSIWWNNRTYSYIQSDQSPSTPWNAEGLNTLNVSYEGQIRKIGSYIYGGNEWRKESVNVSGEDIAVIRHTGGSDIRETNVLEKMTIPLDGKSEIVNIFILPNSKSYASSMGSAGLFTRNGNAIVIDGSSRYEALVHEYSHSQQDYEPSDTMRWIIEGGATYDATVEMEEQGIQNKTEKWSSFTVKEDEVNPNTVLADSDTWKRVTPYSKGQSILVLIDLCLIENTENARVSDIQEDIRESGDSLTYTELVKRISEYSNADIEAVESWLYPYIFGPFEPSDDKIIGDNRNCWGDTGTQSSFVTPHTYSQ